MLLILNMKLTESHPNILYKATGSQILILLTFLSPVLFCSCNKAAENEKYWKVVSMITNSVTNFDPVAAESLLGKPISTNDVRFMDEIKILGDASTTLLYTNVFEKEFIVLFIKDELYYRDPTAASFTVAFNDGYRYKTGYLFLYDLDGHGVPNLFIGWTIRGGSDDNRNTYKFIEAGVLKGVLDNELGTVRRR